MNEEQPVQLDVLARPFGPEAIKHREGAGGKRFAYVETQTVIRRLNEATGNRWDFRVTHTEWRGDLLITTGELTLPGLGTRTGTGVQKVSERGGEDLVKGSASDALKNAARLFGVALDLYGPDWEDADGPQQAAKPRPATQPQRPPQTPQRPAQAPQQASPEPAVDADRKALYDLARGHGITSKSALAKFLYLTPEQYALQTTASLFTRLQAALKATSTTTPSSEAEQAQFDEAPR